MSGDRDRAAVERVRVQVATPNDVWLSSRAEHDKLCADVGSLLALLEEQAGEVERLRGALTQIIRACDGGYRKATAQLAEQIALAALAARSALKGDQI